MNNAAGRTFYMQTFGCKVNQYETEALREAWIKGGGVETDDPAAADVILINSCAVTAAAVSDLRQALRRLHDAAPNAKILLTGCAASRAARSREALPLDGFPGVHCLIDPRRKDALLNVFSPDGLRAVESVGAPQKAQYPPLQIASFARSRAVLKVQDGCSHRCTYCIVPLTRGPSCSRSTSEVVSEARRLMEAGYAEIMISGINLRQYACRAEGCADFWDLLLRLERELAPEWAGRARFRISSVEPSQLDERGLAALAASSLVCPHLHLSLQSGSNAVLARMGRGHYRAEDLLRAVDALRRIWPRFGLGADILTGFPGESPEEAEETVRLVRELPLTYAHVFPYSERPGTAAAAMPGAVPVPERKRRAARLREIVGEKRRNFLESLVGVPSLVALETGGSGHNEWYAPCRVEGEPESAGQGLLPMRAVRVEKGSLVVVPE